MPCWGAAGTAGTSRGPGAPSGRRGGVRAAGSCGRARRYLRAAVASLLADEMLDRLPGPEAFRLEAMLSDGALHLLGRVDGAGILTNVDAGAFAQRRHVALIIW